MSLTLPTLDTLRPRINISTDDIEMLSHACDALTDRRPDLFVVGQPGSGTVVQLTDTGTRNLTVVEIAAILSHEIAWRHVVGDKDTPARPPEQIAKLLAEGQGGLRRLAGITSLPVLRPDGSLHGDPGYDAASGLVVREGARGLAGRVGGDPRQAAGRLLAAVSGAPWEAEHDAWAWLAHVLTVAARPLISGPVPAWIYDATQAGSGKSTLASVASWIVTGQLPSVHASDFDGTAIGRYLGPQADDAAIVIDNARSVGVIRSETLEAMLTSGTIRYDRKYENAVARPFRAVLSITMNNAQAGRDIARRSVLVRLNPNRGHEFRVGDLVSTLAPSRDQLACDALTIIRTWLLTGRPAPAGVLRSFAAWSHVVGGAMTLLGHDDFPGACIGAQAQLDADDDAATEIVKLFAAWLDATKRSEATTAEIRASALATDLLTAVGAMRNVPPARVDARMLAYAFRNCTAWTACGRIVARRSNGRTIYAVQK